MYTAICLLLVLFFLLMNAFFVVAEFALVRVRRSQIDMAVAEKRRGAEAARDVTTHINAYLSACQLGITLASLAIGWLGEPAVSAVLEAPLLAWGFPEAAVYPICVAVGFFIVTTLHVVVGELIPKSFAIFSTEKYALHTAGPLRVFYRVTYPIMVIFNGITNGVMRLFGHDPADEHEVYTGEEIKLLIDESTENGLIGAEENEFVDNIFDLGDKDAEGIMTPRTDVICLNLEDSLEENLELIHQYKYSRYPVCNGSKDHLVGFVHTKDLVDMPLDTPLSDWNIRELPPVPEGIPIAKLLETMQEGRTKICVVVDEHGGTAGIVTMSDIMEQIVGRIDDEYVHDTDDDIEQLPDGTYQVNGTLAIDDLVELLGFEPEDANDVETAGGLLLSLFDRIPDAGDVVVLEDRGTKVTFTVLAMDRLRIDRILVAIEKPEEEE
ncbi:MAG: HlyC/CorC family transporter [Adlercreutzia sp.]|uniref:hemolysin family protein n=1 Tax=uncultured Adlercreutzia sp. TaxID=875803 RepID=UPI002170F930|nr:hemolysin family protein [uncultured Adlercreutzia sp.]MCI8425586.1 HlyC/CorC family transporter [Adlercreutzia sp.]